MADQTDLEKLAKGYMDLWQEHLKGATQDKNATEIMVKTIAMINTGVATFANAMNSATKSAEASDGSQKENDATSSSPKAPRAFGGAAPVTVSLEQSIHIMAQLLERITSLEERVAQLEQNQPTEHNIRIRKRK